MSSRPRVDQSDHEPESFELRPASTMTSPRNPELEPLHGDQAGHDNHLGSRGNFGMQVDKRKLARSGTCCLQHWNDINHLAGPTRLFFKLGLSFFVFGLINNGQLRNSLWLQMHAEPDLSTICHNSLSGSRSCTAIHTERYNCFL